MFTGERGRANAAVSREHACVAQKGRQMYEPPPRSLLRRHRAHPRALPSHGCAWIRHASLFPALAHPQGFCPPPLSASPLAWRQLHRLMHPSGAMPASPRSPAPPPAGGNRAVWRPQLQGGLCAAAHGHRRGRRPHCAPAAAPRARKHATSIHAVRAAERGGLVLAHAARALRSNALRAATASAEQRRRLPASTAGSVPRPRQPASAVRHPA